jgi:8-oxo-dGTP diphosphatase
MQDVRRSIRFKVTGINPHDALEREHIADVLSWIDSGAPLFRVEKPDKPPKHLVSYFVVVDPDHDSMLLCDHIKAQLWLPPGGHVEPGEDPTETVRRESHEELAKPATFLRGNEAPLFATVTETRGLTPGHVDVSLWYVLRGHVHEYIHFDRGEFNDIAWFTFDEILESDPAIFDPHLQRFTGKLKQYLDT